MIRFVNYVNECKIFMCVAHSYFCWKILLLKSFHYCSYCLICYQYEFLLYTSHSAALVHFHLFSFFNHKDSISSSFGSGYNIFVKHSHQSAFLKSQVAYLLCFSEMCRPECFSLVLSLLIIRCFLHSLIYSIICLNRFLFLCLKPNVHLKITRTHI